MALAPVHLLVVISSALGGLQCNHDAHRHRQPAVRAPTRTCAPLALAARRTKAAAAPPKPIESFADLGASALIENLHAMGCDVPMESQALAWSPLRDTTRDVAIISEAGSGKTLAYLVPLVERLLAGAGAGGDRLFVVVPTHDLVGQVCQVARDLCDGAPLSVVAVDAGGLPRGTPRADIVVGTPARCAKLLAGGGGGSGKKKAAGRAGSGERSGEGLLTVVFDEADFMLAGVRTKGGKSGGVENPAANILNTLRRSSKPRPAAAAASRAAEDARALPRVVFVSATVPGQGKSSIGSYLDTRFPQLQWVRSTGAHRPVATLSSEFEAVADRKERDEALVRWCEGAAAAGERTLVFANSAARAEEAQRVLVRAGLSKALVFHPNVPQDAREAALERFSKSRAGLLVCSGLAARGIDLPEVALVVEYQTAPNIVEHMHRVGRTARAGRPGRSVSLIDPDAAKEAALVAEVRRCRDGGWKYL